MHFMTTVALAICQLTYAFEESNDSLLEHIQHLFSRLHVYIVHCLSRWFNSQLFTKTILTLHVRWEIEQAQILKITSVNFITKYIQFLFYTRVSWSQIISNNFKHKCSLHGGYYNGISTLCNALVIIVLHNSFSILQEWDVFLFSHVLAYGWW